MNEYTKELTKLINKIAYRHTPREVFSDFIELSALSVSNSVDPAPYEEREKQYLSLIKKYDPARQKLFPEAFALLVESLEHEAAAGTPSDILGPLFMDLGCGDKGQFFTPQHVCAMMGKMVLSENDKIIIENGFITVSEPCCGAGAMVLGFAQAMQENGYDYNRQMVVTAIDTDIWCIHMCYLQLSLYGIPAVVVHGDSLTRKEWSHWYTPLYVVHGWQWKTQRNNAASVPQDMAQIYEQLNLFEENIT